MLVCFAVFVICSFVLRHLLPTKPNILANFEQQHLILDSYIILLEEYLLLVARRLEVIIVELLVEADLVSEGTTKFLLNFLIFVGV